MIGKSFDHGVLCSSPNSVVVDRAVADDVRRQFIQQGAHFLSPAETDRLAAALVTSQRLPNPAFVGKTAAFIAEQVGLPVPPGTRVLTAELTGVGRDFPLSIEKLCPVLSFYVVADWREGCARCIQILRYGGMGHTMSIHSRNEEVILQFGLKKPAFRIVVNTPTTHGSIGLTTGLDPALTLGCGGWGGNITSDNITPRHLLNVKRLAYELRPAASPAPASPAPSAPRAEPVTQPELPRAPTAPAPRGVDAGTMARQVQSLYARVERLAPEEPRPVQSQAVVDFVCEEDVRQAIRLARKIVIGERTIITPAARDLADAHRVFVTAGWPRE